MAILRNVLTNPSNFKKIADIKTLYDAIRAGSCKAVKLSQVEWNRRVAYNAARVAKGDDVYNEALSASSLGKHKLDVWGGGGGGRRGLVKQQPITWGFIKSTLTVFPVSRAHDTYIIFATIILHSSDK